MARRTCQEDELGRIKYTSRGQAIENMIRHHEMMYALRVRPSDKFPPSHHQRMLRPAISCSSHLSNLLLVSLLGNASIGVGGDARVEGGEGTGLSRCS